VRPSQLDLRSHPLGITKIGKRLIDLFDAQWLRPLDMKLENGRFRRLNMQVVLFSDCLQKIMSGRNTDYFRLRLPTGNDCGGRAAVQPEDRAAGGPEGWGGSLPFDVARISIVTESLPHVIVIVPSLFGDTDRVMIMYPWFNEDEVIELRTPRVCRLHKSEAESSSVDPKKYLLKLAPPEPG
jgi:hypothetical protein